MQELFEVFAYNYSTIIAILLPCNFIYQHIYRTCF